jgi:purine-binding chemotaxis protein CheW
MKLGQFLLNENFSILERRLIAMSKNKITETSLYLTFKLEDEVFAIYVSQVREVLDLSPITKVPRTADFIRGMINVRGSIVPVVDLRLKFGLPPTENTLYTRVVVMEISMDGEKVVLGALADSVHDVIDIDPDQIEPPPSIGTRRRSEFIKGIGKVNDQFIIILDIDKVFSADELEVMTERDLEKGVNFDDISLPAVDHSTQITQNQTTV